MKETDKGRQIITIKAKLFFYNNNLSFGRWNNLKNEWLE